LHVTQLMPLPLTVSCFSKIQIGFTFLVPAHLSSPGQRADKRVCVCVCVCVRQVAKTQLPRDRLYQRIALSPWGNYSFRVLAQNAAGVSEPSASTRDVCTTAPDVPHINPPTTTCRITTPRRAAHQPPRRLYAQCPASHARHHLAGESQPPQPRTQCRINANRGPWQLSARAPLLTRHKDLSQPSATRVDTTCWLLFRSHINTAHFYFLLQKLCQLT